MNKHSNLSLGIAFGIAIGTAIGVATNKPGLWLSLGIALGATLGPTILKKYRSDKDKESSYFNEKKEDIDQKNKS